MMAWGLTVVFSFVYCLVLHFIKSYPRQSFFLGLLLSVVSLTIISLYASLTWFVWAKLWTISGCSMYYLFVCYQDKVDVARTAKIMWILLCINILEAVFWDLQHQHYINFICGWLVVLATPSHHSITIENHRIKSYFPLWWLWAFSFWNWMFVYGCYVEQAIYHVPILLLPIIMARGDSSWLFARCMCLFLWVVFIVLLEKVAQIPLYPTPFAMPYDFCTYLVLIVCTVALYQRWCSR